MEKRDKRKMPCADCRKSNAQDWWCNACGSWIRVDGKAVRPAVGLCGTRY